MTFLTLNDALNYHQKKYQVSKILETLVTKKGYQLIEPDYIENYDRFTRMHRRIKRQEMVKMIDSEGIIRVLRPDITTSIIKELIPQWNNGVNLKLFYNASIFINTPQGIKEQKQFGVEYLGDNTVESDLETIELILEIFKTFNLDFILEISHAGFLNALLETFDLDEENQETLKTILYTKNRFQLNQFITMNLPNNPYKGILSIIFDLQGQVKDIRKRIKPYKLPKSLEAPLNQLENIESSLTYQNLTFDLSLLGQYDYYNSILFKGYLANSPNAILNGGRYDTQKMGYQKTVPAIGFSFTLTDLLKEVME